MRAQARDAAAIRIQSRTRGNQDRKVLQKGGRPGSQKAAERKDGSTDTVYLQVDMYSRLVHLQHMVVMDTGLIPEHYSLTFYSDPAELQKEIAEPGSSVSLEANDSLTERLQADASEIRICYVLATPMGDVSDVKRGILRDKVVKKQRAKERKMQELYGANSIAAKVDRGKIAVKTMSDDYVPDVLEFVTPQKQGGERDFHF